MELLALARGGVCLAPSVTGTGGALLPHLFTLACDRNHIGGLISVALSLTRSPGPVGATHHRVLSCSDFPRRVRRGRLSTTQVYIVARPGAAPHRGSCLIALISGITGDTSDQPNPIRAAFFMFEGVPSNR